MYYPGQWAGPCSILLGQFKFRRVTPSRSRFPFQVEPALVVLPVVLVHTGTHTRKQFSSISTHNTASGTTSSREILDLFVSSSLLNFKLNLQCPGPAGQWHWQCVRVYALAVNTCCQWQQSRCTSTTEFRPASHGSLTRTRRAIVATATA